MSSGTKTDPKLKQKAIDLVIKHNKSITKVARELKLNPSTVGSWVFKVKNPDKTVKKQTASVGKYEFKIPRKTAKKETKKKSTDINVDHLLKSANDPSSTANKRAAALKEETITHVTISLDELSDLKAETKKLRVENSNLKNAVITLLGYR